ncbi:MAG: DNA-directed RNA polymerase subunit alpha [Patescibacteria group bacterium]
MEKIALPKKIEFKQSEGDNSGLVIVEPLYPGYGMTIGNSIRRVLLSSLPGSAVVGVKIKGVKHEFMSLAGVKEDVVDIILNLKQLKLKIFEDTDEVIKLELEIKGKKKVTAGDIKSDSRVEIANKDLIIATTTEATSTLSMEISVACGRGYHLVERNKKDQKEVDYIDMDSIFSPVLLVSTKVENIRVGKMTNWDKLILEVETDGTISVQKAFEDSVEILMNQFKALAPEKKEVEVVEQKKSTKAKPKVEKKEKVEKEKKTKK